MGTLGGVVSRFTNIASKALLLLSLSVFGAQVFAGISATPNPSTGSFTLSWTYNTDNIVGYRVYENGTSIDYIAGHATSRSKSFSNKPVGTYIYLVRVTATEIETYEDENTGDEYEEEIDVTHTVGSITVTVHDPTPSVPTGLNAPTSDGNGAYTVSWSSTANASSYQLQRRLSGGSWSTIHNSSATSRSESGLSNGVWQYRVRACNGSYCSGYSGVDSTQVAIAPGVPGTANISPSTSYTGSHSLTWGAASGSVTKYDVDKRFNGGSWSNAYDGTSRNRTFSGLSTGTHQYAIRACRTTGSYTNCSAWRYSSNATVTVPSAVSQPNAPTNDNNGAYSVSWSGSTGATSYQLQRQANGGSWSTIQTSSATSRSESGLGNAVYGYRVRACSAVGCSAYSPVDTTQVAITPGVPSSITTPGTNYSGTVSLSWGAASGSVSYYDLNKQFNSGSWVGEYDGSALSRTDTGLVVGNYRYAVRACRTTGSYTSCSGWRYGNTFAVTTPATPGTPNAPSGDPDGAYSVSWSTTTGATSYELQRQTNGGSWSTIHNASGTSRSESGLGTATYGYRVRACSAVGCSGYSGIDSTDVAIAPSISPSIAISPAFSTSSTHTVTWGASTGVVAHYRLEQQKNGGSWQEIYVGGATSRAISNLMTGSYHYRIRACNTQGNYTGCSGYRTTSSAGSVATPGVPAGLSSPSTDGDGSFSVSWNISSGASSYNLQRRLDTGAWTTVHSGGATSAAVSGLDNGSYQFRVQACNISGCSVYSGVAATDVAIAPDVPPSIQVPTSNATANLPVGWGAATGQLSKYDLDYRKDGGSWQNSYDGPNLSIVASVSAGNYIYRVRACKTTGSYTNCSDWRTSHVVSLAAPLSAPALSVPQTDEDGDYSVNWASIADSASYQFEESVNSGSWSQVQNNNTTSFSASGKAVGSYRYRARACNDFGCSSYSPEQQITVLPLVQGWADTQTVNVPNATPTAATAPTHDPTVGALAGNGGVSGGQASYSIPIQLPPGRAEVEPAVGIGYSSQAGNGVVGVGFSLQATSAISRCGRSLVHDGISAPVTYSSTNDRLCLDGQRLIPVSGSYGANGTVYRTEMDGFSRITQYGSFNSASTWFQLESKNGMVAYYGNTTDSRVVPAGAPATHTWLIKREQDRTTIQNSIRYHYSNFGRGEVLVSNIYYTGSGDADGDRRVQFEYETRPDISSSYLVGGQTAQTKRLTTISTYYQFDKIREYRLDYQLSAASERSLLSSVQECGFALGSAVCKPATDMAWFDAAPSFELEKVGYLPANTSSPETEGGTLVNQLQSETNIEKAIPYGDVNGDGSLDWPTWFTDAEGVYRGANTSARRSCRMIGAYGMVCAEGDFNRDGRTDAWRISGGRVQLSYNATAAGGGSWINTPILVTHHLKDGPYTIADYNADGWPDLVANTGESMTDGQPRRLTLWLHTTNPQNPYTGNGHVLFTYAQNADGYTNDVQLMGDMNGDNLPDMVEFSLGFSARSSYARKLITTSLNAQGIPEFTQQWDMQTHRRNLPQSDNLEARLRDFDYFMDVNGDGLADWLAWVDTERLWLSLNKGNGTFSTWQDLGPEAELLAMSITVPFLEEGITHFMPKYGHALRQFDYDTDGRSELLVPDERLVTICLTRSTGFGSSEFCGDQIYRSYNVGGGTAPRVPTSIDLASLDYNVHKYKAFHFVEDANGNFTVESRPTELVGAANQALAVDGFGNGLSDLVFVFNCLDDRDSCRIEQQNGAMQSADQGIYINRNRGSAQGNERFEPVDMLMSVEDAIGMKDEWHYRPLSSRDSRYHSAAKPFYEPDFDYLNTLSPAARAAHFHFSSSMYVVAEHRRRNGIGGENRFQYRYKGAMYNWQGRGFQGFRTLIAENLDNGTVTQSDFHQVYPLAGKLHKLRQWETSDASSDSALQQVPAFSETQYSWQFWPRGGKDGGNHYNVDSPTDDWAVVANQPYFVGPDATHAITRTLDVLGRSDIYSTTETSEFDNWGNVTRQVSNYQEPGDAHQVRSEEVTTHTINEGSWWLNRLLQKTVTRNPVASRNGVSINVGTDVQHTLTTDYLAWDTSARKPETMRTTPSSGKTVTVSTQYNSYGLPESVTTTGQGEVARTATTTYTADGYFPRTLRNALNHEVTTDTNPYFGVPNWVDDVNNLRTTTSYDAFGRAISVEAVGVAPPVYTSLQWCQSCSVSNAVYQTINAQEGSPTQIAYIDRLGRTRQVHTQAFDTGQWVVQESRYNTLGQMTFESVPHFAGDFASGTHYLGYDALQRVTQKSIDQTNGQSLLITYNHDQGINGLTTDISAETLSMSRTYNGLGQLTQTVDAIGGTTRYAYDGSGNPIVIQDANNQRITAYYNALNQKQWVNDPNMGLKTFTYNGYGELNSETDANQQAIGYQYDILGRLQRRTINGVNESRWEYDTATNGIGLLAREERLNANFSKTYRYDGQSRVDAVTTAIDGESFVTATQYDSHYGRAKGLVYPNGLTLAYDYNAQGYRTTVSNAASGYIYQQVSDVDARGQWRHAEMGMGVAVANRQFAANTGQMQSLTLDNIAGQLHNQAYTQYDVYGNLREATTQLPSLSAATETENYTYDDLHRLILNERSNGLSINYGYDAVGNLQQKSDYASSYTYNGSQPNAVSQVSLIGGGSKSFGYDNNGNRTHENGSQTLWYNAHNKPSRITRQGTTLTFSYGADLARYKQVNTTRNRTTLYVDKLFEKTTEGSTTEYRLFIEDIAVLTLKNSGTNTIGFTHRDRLGSAVAIVDHLGLLQETHSFDPFGKPRAGSLADKPNAIVNSLFTTRGFTDHEHLDDVQLIHMNGRGYDYNLGQFLSVDPFIHSEGGSQGMNPYSYLLNNPLSGTDPSGYDGVQETTEEKIDQPVTTDTEVVGEVTRTGSRIPRKVTKTVTATVGAGGKVSVEETISINGVGAIPGGAANNYSKSSFEATATGSIGSQGGRENVDSQTGAADNGSTNAGSEGRSSTRQGAEGKTFTGRASIYRRMQEQLNAAGIDVVWFGVAADLNDLFGKRELMLFSSSDFLNELGIALLESNRETFNDILDGTISLRGQDLDNFLVQREQLLVQNYILSRYGGLPPYNDRAFVNLAFSVGRRAMSDNVRMGVNYVERMYKQNFNFWDTSHRITLGESMMSIQRHMK
ncbi:VCBS repeat-containing protein [bacterium SCSIO 12696]|nr:VCBS repeat-containing protein [bacterium SCSIO 12696]